MFARMQRLPRSISIIMGLAIVRLEETRSVELRTSWRNGLPTKGLARSASSQSDGPTLRRRAPHATRNMSFGAFA